MSLSRASQADILARDQQLLTRMARGETTAVAELYACYGRLVFSLIVKLIGDAATAEDLVQDVFVRVWHSAATYRSELGSVRAWLLAIAHHRAVDEWRRRRKEQDWVSLDNVGQAGLIATEDNLTDPLIYRAMQALPVEQRQVIELAYFQGLTGLEIAARLDLAPGTVKSRIRLAMEKLRTHLGVDGGITA